MNIDALQTDVREIVENLAAVKGEDFAQAAVALSRVPDLLRAIAATGQGEPEAAKVATIIARHIVATFGAIVAAQLNVKPQELTQAADAIIAKIRQHTAH